MQIEVKEDVDTCFEPEGPVTVGLALDGATPVSPTPANVRKTTKSPFSHLKLRRFKACN